jgi:hypothetical protein
MVQQPLQILLAEGQIGFPATDKISPEGGGVRFWFFSLTGKVIVFSIQDLCDFVNVAK